MVAAPSTAWIVSSSKAPTATAQASMARPATKLRIMEIISAVKTIISGEDSKAPLSDQRIVEILGQDDIKIARRTVAKYREMLGILSSSKRKKYF